jgi:hypothetical protein
MNQHEQDETRHHSTPPPPPMPPDARFSRRYMPPVFSGQAFLPAFVAFVIVFGPLFWWFFCRIEPREDQIAILIHKTGQDLSSGQILALQPKQKGIQLEVLPEGRYFYNPYAWGWKIDRITDIPAGRLGALTRLYGEDFPTNQIIAGEKTKGIIAEVLRPGKYRINPYAYRVEQFDAI